MQFLIIQDDNVKCVRNIILKYCEDKKFKRIVLVESPPKQLYSSEKIEVYCVPLDKDCYVSTSLENGWPFLQTIIEKEEKSAVSIRYSENRIAEFIFWKNGEKMRILQALKDTKWVWYTHGELLPFEEAQFYEKKRIRDRLTKELIYLYLERLNIKNLSQNSEALPFLNLEIGSSLKPQITQMDTDTFKGRS